MLLWLLIIYLYHGRISQQSICQLWALLSHCSLSSFFVACDAYFGSTHQHISSWKVKRDWLVIWYFILLILFFEATVAMRNDLSIFSSWSILSINFVDWALRLSWKKNGKSYTGSNMDWSLLTYFIKMIILYTMANIKLTVRNFLALELSSWKSKRKWNTSIAIIEILPFGVLSWLRTSYLYSVLRHDWGGFLLSIWIWSIICWMPRSGIDSIRRL